MSDFNKQTIWQLADELFFDGSRSILFIPAGEEAELSYKEGRLIQCLIDQAGHPVTKAQIIEHVWSGVVVTDASLTKIIASVRNKIKLLAPEAEVIISVPRVGYRIQASKIIQEDEQAREISAEPPLSPGLVNHWRRRFNLLCLVISVTLLALAGHALYWGAIHRLKPVGLVDSAYQQRELEHAGKKVVLFYKKSTRLTPPMIRELQNIDSDAIVVISSLKNEYLLDVSSLSTGKTRHLRFDKGDSDINLAERKEVGR
ncbi:winged helix-turn-helix domain-containing protein [Dongshaea marina]|uniref:winged helix-turn-helix domain-containing protein n=1 Tax=Dongshaea marina TaxID=2047966 RepID=UPI000D3E183E|nr:winged helix-turn-helix domain-containing protein [Dongshaea marina]